MLVNSGSFSFGISNDAQIAVPEDGGSLPFRNFGKHHNTTWLDTSESDDLHSRRVNSSALEGKFTH
jgi:hypothetical protein